MIKTKRVYEKKGKNDGYRILVDRLWPRGVTKEKAHLNLWIKEIAPSPELRVWFHHDPNKWSQFTIKYKKELQDKKELLTQIRELEKKYKVVTLLFGAKDAHHNEAIVLKEVLEK